MDVIDLVAQAVRMREPDDGVGRHGPSEPECSGGTLMQINAGGRAGGDAEDVPFGGAALVLRIALLLTLVAVWIAGATFAHAFGAWIHLLPAAALAAIVARAVYAWVTLD